MIHFCRYPAAESPAGSCLPLYVDALAALDEADAAIDEDAAVGDERTNKGDGAGKMAGASRAAALSGKPVPTESSNTVWIGR
jgi:hypothetical protein